MKARATVCCTIQLGSISSLRCQKSRRPRLSRLRHAKRCFRGRLFEANNDQPSGGARRDRTDDLMLAKHALSQLSYGPVTRRRMLSSPPPLFELRRDSLHSSDGSPSQSWRSQRRLVGLGRLELPTSRLSSARSNQLSYKPLHEEHARAHRPDADASHKRSPWRVFVREERETKTAKSRQWSSTIWRSMAPDVSKTIR
jgi:hypothetical protein